MANFEDDETNAVNELMRIAQVYVSRGDLLKAQELMAFAQEIMRRKTQREERPQDEENCG
jgi:hypothetical protein